MALANFFTGRVAQREYARELDFEYVPNYSTVSDANGNVLRRYIASYSRNLMTAKVVEQTFRFTGATYADAHTTSDVSVTDNNGTSWTVPMKQSITDGSTGSRVMIIEEVSVERTPISPRMWEVVVTRRGLRYFVNGSQMLAGPAWISSYV